MDKSTSQVHQPIVLFPNRLKNNKQNPHMDKIIDIFNQVKINVPLLDAIQQVPSYAKFIKDMCTKKSDWSLMLHIYYHIFILIIG